MPIHDWTRVDAGTFHHFHHGWTARLSAALNRGVLPEGYFALSEPSLEDKKTGIKPNRISIRKTFQHRVAIVEIVHPTAQSDPSASVRFVELTSDFLQERIHVLLIDLFPPSLEHPTTMNSKIWNRVTGEPMPIDGQKCLALTSFRAEAPVAAFVEPVAVGDELPSMPVFLAGENYVSAPLESTYMETWDACPGIVRELFN